MKGNTMNTTMYTATEQFADLNKANVAQATKLAALALENTEKLMKLNLNAAKIVLAQGVEGASAVASVKDVQDLFALRAKYAESGVETATAYTRSLYEISSEAQAQFTALAEEAWSTYTKDVAGWVEKASKSAPAGSEAAVNAFKSTFAASTAAFDQLQKATKQVVSLADASVRAASANATKAAAKVRKAA
jgi:phasin family protein